MAIRAKQEALPGFGSKAVDSPSKTTERNAEPLGLGVNMVEMQRPEVSVVSA
jgi:hypothetical protein